jgi:hypothetical protein
MGADPHQPLILQRAQEPAEVSRVQAEAAAQIPDGCSASSDLEEEPRLGQRPGLPQVAVGEFADDAGVEAVELAECL